MFADQLRKSILQAAIQGKLTEQLPTDGNARNLLKKIRAEKDKLLAERKIKAEKPLPHITDDEIPFDLPENWYWCRLGEVCSLMQYGTAKKSKSYGEIPVLRMGNLQNGKIDYTDLVYSSDEDDIKNYKLDFNDILFNRTNSADLVGKTAIYKSEREAIFAGYLIRLKVILVKSDFINLVMQSAYYKTFCYSIMGRGVSQANISAEKLKIFLLPIPPLDEQKRIVARVEELLAEVNELARDEQELTALEENFPRRLKSSLLQAAVQGKLTEQLPTDGDARDLLKKIRAEKDKLLAEKKIKADKPLPLIIDDEIPFDLPDNWCWCRLGDVCEMYTGNSIAESEKKAKYLGLAEGFSYIGTKDISFDNQINYNNGVRIPFENNFRRANKNSVLMCIEGGSAGRKIAITDRDVYFGNKLCNFNADKISNEYIYYYLQSPTFLKFFRDNVTGMIGGVSLKRLNSILLPFPPLAEQKRILKKLNELLPLCTI